MRTLYGFKVPDGARLAEVRGATSQIGRARVIFRGPLEQDGQLLTEDTIADAVACDGRFWDWVNAQVRQKHRTGSIWGWEHRPAAVIRFIYESRCVTSNLG